MKEKHLVKHFVVLLCDVFSIAAILMKIAIFFLFMIFSAIFSIGLFIYLFANGNPLALIVGMAIVATVCYLDNLRYGCS